MLIPDKCMKCKLDSDERFKKCKDCRYINTCEPLINKTRIAITVKNKPLMFLKDDVHFAVNFYKRYSKYSNCSPEFVFKREQPKAYKQWNKVRNKIYKIMKYPCFDTIDKIHFNHWLFDYCFKDVI